MLKYGNLDELASVAVTLPTGEKGFSNDRTDIEIASRTTYRTSNGYQANLTLKRIFTGENDNGVNPPDATYVGLLVGKKLSKNFFFDAGPIIDMSDDGTYVVSAKGMSRLFLSKYCFIEFGGTQSVKSHKGSESEKMAIPETGIEFQLRYSK
jgi:hypothetical protein